MAQLRFPTEVGSTGNDAIIAANGTIQYGNAGDDTYDSDNTTNGPTWIGGAGGDVYNVATGAYVNIDDGGNTTGDVVHFGGAVGSYNVTLLNDAHLFFIDTATNTGALLLNWTDEDNQIENIQFTDQTYNYSDFLSIYTLLAGYQTPSTFEAQGMLPAGASQADFDEMISYYHNFALTPTDALNASFTVFTGSDLGDDTVGGDDNDSMTGGAGDDTLDGGAASDFIHGNLDDDLLFGRDGKDTLYGGKGDDSINGNMGEDTVSGQLGNDSVRGGKGEDSVNGGQGDDSVYGDFDDDTVSGDLGNDFMRGGKGNDIMLGSDGNDTLYGDLGSDTMTGGDGEDIFAFSAISSGNDSITDFERGVDHIQVTAELLLAGIVFSNGIMSFTGSGEAIIINSVDGFLTLDNTDLVIL